MTLLLTHPACLDHLTPPGHPERPDRLRAVAEVLGEERFNPLVRGEAPEGRLESVTLCHGEHYVGELRHIAPTSGMIYIDGDTSMSPGTWEAVMRGVGGAVAATDAVMSGAHAQRVRRRASARPSRRSLKADGLLLLRQCRDRRPPRPAQIRHRPRRGGRFRRPSRQRHPGYFLGRSDRDVLLDAPDAAVSRHRRLGRARRTRHHRQCAAGVGGRQRQVPRRVRKPDPAATAEIQPRTHHHLRRLRRAFPRSRWLRSM